MGCTEYSLVKQASHWKSWDFSWILKNCIVIRWQIQVYKKARCIFVVVSNITIVINIVTDIPNISKSKWWKYYLVALRLEWLRLVGPPPPSLQPKDLPKFGPSSLGYHAAMYLSWMALECRALAYYSNIILVV